MMEMRRDVAEVQNLKHWHVIVASDHSSMTGRTSAAICYFAEGMWIVDLAWRLIRQASFFFISKRRTSTADT